VNTKFLSLKSLSKSSELGEKIIVVLPDAKIKSKNWANVFASKISSRITKSLARRAEGLKAGETHLISGVEKTDADIVIAVLPEDRSTFEFLGFAAGAVKAVVEPRTTKLSLVFLEAKEELRLADVFGAAISARIFEMPVYGKRRDKLKPYRLNQVTLVTSENQTENFSYGFETVEGENLVRMLGALPPNDLNTKTYGKKIRELCQKYKFKLKFYSNTELAKMGAGAFTAVDRGDPESSGGIYEISHLPSKAKNKKPVVFVGKGLCYDTGGYDIKTQSYMIGMKVDMSGSAVALSNLITISRLGWPIHAKAFLGVTENHISPRAYKADEVVTALNGISIEVINTDAEGRMVLADTLCLASKANPEMILDFATLTGSSMIAIGTSYAAVFSNREELHARLVAAGRVSGERVWPFPLDKDYGKALESPIADFIQCIKGRGPDHILAAFFLQQFVKKEIPWVHVDIAGPADRQGGLAHMDTLQTGFGVRWTMEFLKSVVRF
jgi:leucyl aminopeptidase